ncbi:hypothetical protein PAF17_15885 [Paracoccus sp. Z330]|uniref:Uncharacterized protein n=1 Tax=Paracoccus onchidii TaxID=3017813 RepID=A0ABT4ZHY8_9RHOB|nr:hypothetical protein [Paracoccus onchidii]MDB6178972.1 hypothetical protein [Paracoccus onchidii]
MIRQPTSAEDQYSFWRRSVSGERVARIEDDPQPGFYKRRMVKDGPFVPVEIWMDQEIDPITGELTAPETYLAICNAHPCDPLEVWTYCRPISAEEYDALTGARQSIPAMADTHTKIDLGQLAAIRP